MVSIMQQEKGAIVSPYHQMRGCHMRAKGVWPLTPLAPGFWTAPPAEQVPCLNLVYIRYVRLSFVMDFSVARI